MYKLEGTAKAVPWYKAKGTFSPNFQLRTIAALSG
jgi:hypothetical protein